MFVFVREFKKSRQILNIFSNSPKTGWWLFDMTSFYQVNPIIVWRVFYPWKVLIHIRRLFLGPYLDHSNCLSSPACTPWNHLLNMCSDRTDHHAVGKGSSTQIRNNPCHKWLGTDNRVLNDWFYVWSSSSRHQPGALSGRRAGQSALSDYL